MESSENSDLRSEISKNMEEVNSTNSPNQVINNDTPETRRASKRKRPTILERLTIDYGKNTPAKKPRIDETNNAKEVSQHPILKNGEDQYCWTCHRNVSQNNFRCSSCKKVYHPKCYDTEITSVDLNWICPQCILIKDAENPGETLKPGYVDPIIVNDLLVYTLERLQLYPAYKEFLQPINTNEHTDYLDYVLTPMDLGIIENKIKTRSYQSTESFLLDLRYLLHNSYIYYSCSSELTSSARQMIRIARQDCDEIESCSECYKNAHIMPKDMWFIEACTRPHLLVWAKLKGFPYWPAKLMKVIDDEADIRFFGDHNRSMIPVSQVYLFSPQTPDSNSTASKNYRNAIKEIENHIEKLKQVHGTFKYAPNNMKYVPEKELEQLKIHLPNYNLPKPWKALTPRILNLKKPIKKSIRRKKKPSFSVKRRKGKKSTDLEVTATTDIVSETSALDQNAATTIETRINEEITESKEESSYVVSAIDVSTAESSNQNNITNEATPRILNVKKPVKKASSRRKKASLSVKRRKGKKSTDMKVTASTDVEVTATNDVEVTASTDVEVTATTDVEVTATTDMEVNAVRETSTLDQNNAATTIETSINEGSIETKEENTPCIEIIEATENQVEEVVLPTLEAPKINNEKKSSSGLFINHLNSEVSYFSIPKVNSKSLENPPKSTPLPDKEYKKTEVTITPIVPKLNIVLVPNCKKVNNEMTPIHNETITKPEIGVDFKIKKLSQKNQEIQQMLANKNQIPVNDFKVPQFSTKMPSNLTLKMNGSNLNNSNNSVIIDVPKPIKNDSQDTTQIPEPTEQNGTVFDLYELKTEGELQPDDTESTHEIIYPEQISNENVKQSNKANNSIISMLLTPNEMHAVQQSREFPENQHNVEQIQDEILTPIPQPSITPLISLKNVLVSPKTKPEINVSVPKSEDEEEIRKITTYDVLASIKYGKTTQEMYSIATRELEYLQKFYESTTIDITNRCASQIEEFDQKLKEQKENSDREMDIKTNEFKEELKKQKEYYEKQKEYYEQQKENYEKKIQELKSEVQYSKKKSWCAFCLLEAEYFCCPNAYYCSIRCQQSDETHIQVCTQSNENLEFLRKSNHIPPERIEDEVVKNVQPQTILINSKNLKKDAPIEKMVVNLQANNNKQDNVLVVRKPIQNNVKVFRTLPLGKNTTVLPQNPGNKIKTVENLPVQQKTDVQKASGSKTSTVQTLPGYRLVTNSMLRTIKIDSISAASKTQQAKKIMTILPRATTITPVNPQVHATHDGLITLNDQEIANIMNKDHLGDLS